MLKQCAHVTTTLLGADLVQHLNVLLRKHLEQELVAGASCGVAGARFAFAQHRKRNACHVQQLGDGLRCLLRAVFKRTRAPDPEQVVDVFVERAFNDRHLERQVCRPVHAGSGVHSPGFPLFSRFLNRPPSSAGNSDSIITW